MIELRTFGALDLRAADGRELRPILAQPKRLALLIYLATLPGYHRRDALLGLLWPDSDPARARAALSRAVHYLRSHLGEGVLLSRGDEELGLDPASFSCDVVRFHAALQRADFPAALDLYRGDFLEAFFVDDVPEFERWVDQARADLRTRAASAARSLSQGAEQKDNLELALHWARRAAGLAPYDEGDMRRVVTLLERSGERASAIDFFQRFAKRLHDDLGLDPGAESRQLFDTIAGRDRDAIAEIPVPSQQRTRAPGRRRVALFVIVTLLALIAVLVPVALRRRGMEASGAATARSIAVLPFANLSGDSANQYFTDGMTDELIGALSEVRTLRVAARTSSFAYRDRALPVREIARELNVATILEGSVRREGERLRITVQLADAERGFNLWSKTYDRRLRDVFALQDEISREVVNALEIRLMAGREPPPGQTTDVETYDLYLWGRYHWNSRSDDGLRRALTYFERAAARDPRYAPAFTGLADTYNLLVIYDLSAKEIMPKAKAAAERALALDDTDSEAHAARAYIATWFDWDWEKAESHFRRALELNPNNATAHHWYSIYLVATGRLQEGLHEMDVACDLDPASLFLRGARGVRLYQVRDYEGAVEQLERVFAIQPHPAQGYPWLGVSYLKLNRVAEAVSHLERARSETDDRPVVLAALATAYAGAGRQADALALINEVERRAQREPFFPSWLARAYTAVGDHDRALTWLERAYEERDGWLTTARIDPAFDPLRDEPRFQKVLERMGL